jgi:hypothetical protein
VTGRCVGADLSRFVHDCVENFHCIFYRANLATSAGRDGSHSKRQFVNSLRENCVVRSRTSPKSLCIESGAPDLHLGGRVPIHTVIGVRGLSSRARVPEAVGTRAVLQRDRRVLRGPQTKGLANAEQTGRAVSIRRQRSLSKLKMRSFSHNSEECGGSRSRTILQHRLPPAMIG